MTAPAREADSSILRMRIGTGKNVVMSAEQESPTTSPVFDQCRARYGTFSECPLCGNGLIPEHAHFKCTSCGWRDSCCD